MTQDTPNTKAETLVKSLKTLFQGTMSRRAPSNDDVIDAVNSVLDLIEFDPVREALNDENISSIVNISDSSRRTALLRAVQERDKKTALRLLAIEGIDVHSIAHGDNSRTILMYAACWGDKEVVQRLLAIEGIDVHARTVFYDHTWRGSTGFWYGQNAAEMAEKHGHLEIAQLIEDHMDPQKTPAPALAAGPA